MASILLVEDEKVLAKNIAFFLEKEGHKVDIVHDGRSALARFEQNAYSLLLLDWTLPKMDGLEVCRHIRQSSTVPIMMITAKGEIMDKVVGLEVGADDYIVKPFHQRELLARIHALLRRNPPNDQMQHGDTLTYHGVQLDREKMVVSYHNERAALTANEYKLLDAFMKHPLRVFSREVLFEQVWGDSSGYSDRTVDVTISRLRKKMSDLTGKKYIHALRGMGYRFGEEE